MSISRRTKLARLTTAVAVAATGLVGVSTSAQADPNSGQSTTPTMVILDASGSMRNDDAPGRRIDAAKDAIHDLVAGLPSDAQVGLVVYGTSTGSAKSDKPAGCTDVKTIVPVGPIDAASFLSTVDGITASGYTPIGEALRHAARELPQEGPRSIVLVSDGQDTCSPPPPCEVAKEIAGDGLDLKVHTVGFKVDKDARKDLRCIAEATGGSYADAKDADQLGEALQQKVKIAIRGYDVFGTPVRGAESSTAADLPLLAPGQYVDTLPAKEKQGATTERYYRIAPEPGWTPHVTVTGVVAPDAKRSSVAATVSLEVEALGPDGKSCASGYGSKQGIDDVTEAVVAAISSGCEGESILRVTRKDRLYHDSEMTVEIVVRFEPPSDISHVPEPEERGLPEVPEVGDDPTRVFGGTSFNSAIELQPGVDYADALLRGEQLYYKVPVTWGQQIAYRFRQDGPLVTEPSRHTDANLEVRLYDPMRIQLVKEAVGWRVPKYGEDNAELVGGTEEVVRATSRQVNLDGYYYLVVGLWTWAGDATQDVAFTVVTPGEVEEGPIYLTDTAPTSAPSPSPELSPSMEPTTRPAPPTDDGTGSLWPTVGIAAAAAAAGGGAVLLLRRRGTRE